VRRPLPFNSSSCLARAPPSAVQFVELVAEELRGAQYGDGPAAAVEQRGGHVRAPVNLGEHREERGVVQ